mmetsp:Transcript_19222/g.31544  ORF Transcript_19222/g.31544 Transcript_19222/m.31544 type:complete len:287 (-) Transcript_19222:21-881(-)
MEFKSIKELKSIISGAGMSFEGCFEKSELVVLANEAAEKMARDGGEKKDGKMKFGKYECIVRGMGGKCDGIVIILHGFGATSQDFVPLSDVISSSLPDKRLVYVFPQAHIGKLGSSAWWDIDVMRWQTAMSSGEAGIAGLIREKPDGLDACRDSLKELVDQVIAKIPGENVPIVLGGFSQGAMTAMDAALHLPEEHNVKSVMMLSGGPIVVEEWGAKLRTKGKDIQVFISHGQSDMMLPCVASGWTRDLLKANDVSVVYETHRGGHELGGPEIIQKLVAFVKGALA